MTSHVQSRGWRHLGEWLNGRLAKKATAVYASVALFADETCGTCDSILKLH